MSCLLVAVFSVGATLILEGCSRGASSTTTTTSTTTAAPLVDCTIDVPFHCTPSTMTIKGIDKGCCATAEKDARNATTGNPPQCIVGKAVSMELSYYGGTCSGDPCDITGVPMNGFDLTMLDVYGWSSDCCTSFHKQEPELPIANCTPKKHCFKMEGTIIKSMMTWMGGLEMPAHFSESRTFAEAHSVVV